MNVRLKICVTFLAASALSFGTVCGQTSSLNTYSPYTFYGIGDIHTQGIAVLRSMGGAGLGFRNPVYINYLNPASYSSVRNNSFLMNFGMEGQNFYESTSSTKTSFNTFNIRDIALSFPLYDKLGLGLSVTPYSSVGYRVQYYDQSPDVLSGIGQMKYAYSGDGGVTQFKLGVGYELFKNFSVGADLIYYHGSIERTFNAVPTVITGSGSYQTLSGTTTEDVNSFYGNFGLQWTAIANERTALVIGAIYQTGGKMNNDVYARLPVNSTLAPSTYAIDTTYVSSFAMPATYGIGAYLHRTKYSIGADYQFSDWGRRNPGDATSNMSFRNTHTVRLGGQYTPSPGDVRHLLRRWTYSAGLRYSQYYVVLNGKQIDDVAFTCGLGIPLRMTGLSNINLGLELGQRGTTAAGLAKETYFKFSIGFSLFGEDYWFVKFKYD